MAKITVTCECGHTAEYDESEIHSHRLICGDSTDSAVIDRLMDGVKADMVFTDPPYGNGTSGKYGRGQLGVRTIAGDEDLSVFNNFISIVNTDKIVYFLQWRTLAESLETIRNKGLKINTVGVWDKKNAGLNGAGGISEQWEAVIFAGNIKYKKFGGNVFSISREQHKREDSPHPHQKPIKLLAEIFDFIDECKIVLDPFGGSGSTLIACEQLDRKCYMAELSPEYVDVIIARWEKLTGKKAELL
jgi:DNA modification methylase